MYHRDPGYQESHHINMGLQIPYNQFNPEVERSSNKQ